MTAALASPRRMLGRLIRDKRALGAVEFALTAPFLILLYVGGYQLMDVISARRKVTITARTLADLSTQNEQITPAKADDILLGARQVMTPYSTTNATLVFAELKFDSSSVPSVVWTWPSDQHVSISDIDFSQLKPVANSYIVFSQIVFHYTPAVAGTLIGPLTFTDHIFMNPRKSNSICLNMGTVDDPVCAGEGAS